MTAYKLVDGSTDDKWNIEITNGNYRGVIISLNDIYFEEEADNCIMRIDYDLVDDKGAVFGEDWNDTLGALCTTIIEDSIKHHQAKEEIAKRELFD